MCGIVAIVPPEPADPAVLTDRVRRMAKTIAHRGPDDEGFHVTPDVALGVRRLSILDVAGGHQPMTTADGAKTIVFNGEIYNHLQLREELSGLGRRFHTRCDTETVLEAVAAWGDRAVERLEGMFGFAVWDARAKTLLLARDWMGQKSLYYTRTSLGWLIASEIKALLALEEVERELDVRSLSDAISLRYLPVDRTFFRGIAKVPAAHRAHVRGAQLETERCWSPAYQPKWSGSEAEVLDELDTRLHAVVGEHLMSDVPLGAFLSGGIDSSLMVAYAAQASPEPVRTFSIGVDDDSQSELPWARQVAERYATRHIERVMKPDLAGLAPRMVAAMEEPVDPFCAGVYVVSEAAAREVTVCLGGDGGDELFAGYDRYLGQQLAETYAHLPRALRRGLLRPLFRRIPESFGYKSLATRLRWLDRMAELEGFERYAESAAFLRFPHDAKARLFTPVVWREVGAERSEELLREYFEDGCAEAFVDKMLHADCMTRLMDHQLPIVDKMSMAHSLEVRSPLLDRRVVELAMRIPAAWKLRKRRIKYLTRRLGERYLPRDLLYREKQGFGFPLALWFRGELRPLIERTVAESRLAERGVFRREAMEHLVGEHVSGQVDHNYRLWLLLNIELFHRHWIEREPVEALEGWIERARRSG